MNEEFEAFGKAADTPVPAATVTKLLGWLPVVLLPGDFLLGISARQLKNNFAAQPSCISWVKSVLSQSPRRGNLNNERHHHAK